MSIYLDLSERLDHIIEFELTNSPAKLTRFQHQFFKDNPDVDWPKCECGCGKFVVLNVTDSNQVFRRFASAQCSRKSKTVPQQALDKLSDKEWLYDQRIVQQKSKELIGQELGVSEPVITKWIDIHGIPKVRFNESEHRVQSILNDKEKLVEDYNTGKTLEKLAEEYGTSRATLSRFFKSHGIQTRQPNDYPREGKTSKEQLEVYNWIKSVYSGEVWLNVKGFLSGGRDLDIYVPRANLAIEYNGLFSHIYRPQENTIGKIKDSTYHLNKTIESLSHNIQLIHLFSDQWKKKRCAVETMFLAKLGLNNRIFARKCLIQEVSVHDKNTFLQQYHIQGEDKSKFAFGLYFDDEPVAIMTFRSPRYNSQYDWELMRFCCKKGITVVGGFSKLLQHFRKNHSGSIVSYADRTYSNGDVYRKNNFQLTNTSRPSYWYVNTNTETRMHRSYYTKKRMLELIKATKKTNKSEDEISKDLKLEKLWNCGTLTFVLS